MALDFGRPPAPKRWGEHRAPGWRGMPAGAAVPGADDGGEGGDAQDYPAGGASSAQIGKKRRSSVRGGHDACWTSGCGACEELMGIPAASIADAQLFLKERRELVGRELPTKLNHNRHCPRCYPVLPHARVIGSKVCLLVKHEGEPAYACGEVKGPGSPTPRVPADQADAAVFGPQRRWAIEYSTDARGPALLTTERVWELSDAGDALVSALKNEERRVRGELGRARDNAARPDRVGGSRYIAACQAEAADRAARAARAAAEPPPPPKPQPKPPPPPLVPQLVKLRMRLPEGVEPGKVAHITIPAGYLPGSEVQEHEFHVQDGHRPDQMVSFQVWLRAPAVTKAPAAAAVAEGLGAEAEPVDQPQPRPPSGDPPPRPPHRRSSNELGCEIRSKATALGLTYDPQPNELNPIVAWPIRPCLSFANLRPEYFGLPERGALFQSMFGFPCWGDFEHFFHVAFVKRGLVKSRAVLSARFQCLAALWRMRQALELEPLAAFFGVTRQTMGGYINEWIPRLGMFAKANLVWLPSMSSITELMPQSFTDCGMGHVVLVGDCKDHAVHTQSGSIVSVADQHSSKSGASVAIGLAWCTPNGFVACAADLALGRSSCARRAASSCSRASPCSTRSATTAASPSCACGSPTSTRCSPPASSSRPLASPSSRAFGTEASRATVTLSRCSSRATRCGAS